MLAEFRDVKKIIVIKLRHIGDVLLITPAIKAVNNTFPNASITALVNSGTDVVLQGNPLINEIVTLDRSLLKQSFFRRIKYEISFLSNLRKKGFDMAIDLTGGDRPALYCFLSGARYRIGFDDSGGLLGKRYLYSHRFKVNRENHNVIQNLELLSKAGIETKDCGLDFYISRDDHEWLRNKLKENGIEDNDVIVHIHSTSRWLFKCWKDEYMACVINRIQKDYRVNVVLTCSPDKKEMAKANRIVELARVKPISFIGNIDLKKVGAISKRARLFFGVDSAPMHIASAVGTPVVAIFGPSGAFHWGPWDNEYMGRGLRVKGQENPYSKKNGIQVLGKHTVIQRDWDCIPCGKDGCEGSKISNCIEDIGVDEVMEIIGRYLRE